MSNVVHDERSRLAFETHVPLPVRARSGSDGIVWNQFDFPQQKPLTATQHLSNRSSCPESGRWTGIVKPNARHTNSPDICGERPDYAYLKEVFRHRRAELDVDVQSQPKKLPYVPSEAEIRRYYQPVRQARCTSDVVLIKTLRYTGVRVIELIRIRIADVDLDAHRIRISQSKGGKERIVPFPEGFKETLALQIDAQHAKNATFLFESSWK